MLEKLTSNLRRIREAARYRSVPGQLIDVVTHKVKLDLAPGDYYAFEFYKGGKSWDEKSRYVGRYGSLYWPFENTHLKFNILFTNKYVEKLAFKGAGLPTARLLAWVSAGGVIRNENELREFLQRQSRDMVVKPARGTHGNQVWVLSRIGGELRTGGKPCTAKDVWDHVNSDLENGFIIEEKLTNTSDLSALYATSLNTFRIVTIKTLDQRWHLAAAYLRIGAGGKVVDNVLAGGIMLRLDERGRTVEAYHNERSITHHPDTGANLIGIELEGYRAACDLALRASRTFGFVGTIGWDIAVTDHGPMIVEGNLWWSLTFQTALGGVISDALAAGLRKRTPFMRWDKSKMFPGYSRKRWPLI